MAFTREKRGHIIYNRESALREERIYNREFQGIHNLEERSKSKEEIIGNT